MKDYWTYPQGVESTVEEDLDDRMEESGTHLLLSMHPALTQQFKDGYKTDPYFKDRYAESVESPAKILTPSHFRRGPTGLLYFFNADWEARLCIPRSMVQFVLEWIHESREEAAHGG
ncbi:hypothetical protein GGG16DRAFT_66906, partial [Schizophyllum commune]